MIGYWNEPIATAGALVNGWFHTGDLVSQDPDGHVWFRGRKKEIIVRGGRKTFHRRRPRRSSTNMLATGSRRRRRY
jgi:acyl-CoA synthetase (AMP-forming)/AMP-acid ligase II